MKILHILPEFQEGGVERHVLWLSNELAASGHGVTVVSAGGKLEDHLKGVRHISLPVHRKNPGTGIYSAIRIARYAKSEKIDIIHAHSRVPAWIAWWASTFSGVPWIATCHGFYSKNAGLIPYGHARLLICVSDSVRTYMSQLFPKSSFAVLYNGLPEVPFSWRPPADGPVRFLFVGRLTEKKGLRTVLESLSSFAGGDWVFDIVGDGPLMDSMKELTRSLSLENQVFYHGFQDVPEKWMEKCSCFLFPSLEEGMGLTLMRTIQMAVPVIASDLPAVRELAVSSDCLLPPGRVESWREQLLKVLKRENVSWARFDKSNILSTGEMAKKVLEIYREIS